MGEKTISKYLVASAVKAETKGGKKYLRLELYEKGGKKWPAVFWEDRDLPSGVLIDASTEVSDFNGTAQLTVHALRQLADLPGEDWLPKTPYDIDELRAELNEFITRVQNPHLKSLLQDVEQEPLWRRAPAAKTLHHAYLGGLLEHTVSMCRVAANLCERYKVSYDLVITGVVIHDIGKMQEYTSGLNIETTIAGELIGHITLGALKIDRLMDRYKEGFGTSENPTELRLRVLHMLISHHGQLAYGSPKEPITPEADLLCKVDGVDAGVTLIQAHIAKAAPNAVFTDKVKWEKRFFIGEKGKQ